MTAKERRDALWDLGSVALIFACAVGLGGITSTTIWVCLGSAALVSGLIIAHTEERDR
ncbi:hypothetical protein ND991_17975 [Gordonia sputi]|uniref:hypothetical protein n=1 Tax=Gordonia sputi TaxID=36823 RepID=UPI002043D8A3|nr:hypothetical protein [Gordonia sputi]MCM3897097.1 hypothetical protein [Gordonia sputi]